MKLICSLPFLCILLFVQLGNGDWERTFASLLRTFYSKAAGVDIIMRGDLDFILRICDNTNATRQKLEPPATRKISKKEVRRIDNLINIVSPDLEFGKAGALAILLQELKEIKFDNPINIKGGSGRVNELLGWYDLRHRQDDDFNRALYKWRDNPTTKKDKKHIENVKKSIPKIKSAYNQVRSQFDTRLQSLVELKPILEIDMLKVETAIDGFYDTTDSVKIDKIALDVIPVIRKILKDQKTIRSIYSKLVEAIQEYNEFLQYSTEFLIGMHTSFVMPNKNQGLLGGKQDKGSTSLLGKVLGRKK